MSLRFRRSVRLFPGVRLNFSLSGVSTTIGVRGASVTVGPRGTHVNAGIPGSGLSYRTPIAPPRVSHPTSSTSRNVGFMSPQGNLPEPNATPTSGPTPERDVVEIRSAEVSQLTSPGLGELKRLINEAALKRRQLVTAVSEDQRLLDDSIRKLQFAQTFIVRIFTQNAVTQLAQAVADARETLEAREIELEGCVIEVDFSFDDASLVSYAALVRGFESLATCQRIWDVTAVQSTNQVLERTLATTALSRTLVTFDFTAPEIVKSAHLAMRLGNASGRYIHLYPGFLLMKDGGGDFALIEYSELEAGFSQSRFIEEGSVPSDAEVVGQTWKKANKDGSPDRRFRDNYAIPIVRYGELIFRSATGLFEAYLFSAYDKADTFHQALMGHRRSLEELSRKGGVSIADEAIDDLLDDQGAPGEVEPLAFKPPEPPNLIMDWIVLVVGIVAVIAGLAGSLSW